MNIAYYRNLFDQLGIINSAKYVCYQRILQSLRYKKKEWKLKIKFLGKKVIVRPATTDFELIGEFFLNGAVNVDSVFQYDIDFTDKIQGDVKYIIDGGANIGFFSLLYHRMFPNATIVAIEPEDDNFRILQRNTEEINNIKLIQGGVWNKNCYLRVEPSKTGSWGFTVKECAEKEADVNAYSIKNIMEQYGLPFIDILKMDIEGSEFYVFDDDKCNEWLGKVKCLIIECHDDKVAGCEDIVYKRMRDLDYRYEVVGENIVFYK